MTTQEPDWKALCVAYVKADERLSQLTYTENSDDAFRRFYDAIAAIYAAVKAHGDA